MGIDIQWERLAPSNSTANVLQGYEAGDGMRKKRVTENALALYDTDPEAAVKALMPVDLGAALQLRTIGRQDKQDAARMTAADQYGSGDVAGATKTAIGAGDFDMAKEIASLTKEQRVLAQQNIEQGAGFAATLRNLPPEEVKARIQHNRDWLKGHGYSDQQIDGFDGSPGAVEGVIGQAIDLKTALEEANRQRDDVRAQETLSETKRANQERERLGRQNAGTSAYSAQTGRMSFNERKRAGGFGTPGAATGTWEPLD